ncbi:MAG: response regulator [Deltaproteobacteria bacterium]|nr:response regulator [Deltaproteobacteria bacterium]
MARRFSLMLKLLTLVIVLTVVTAIAVSYVATEYVFDLGTYALESNSALGDLAAKDSADALNSLGERMIQQKSKDVAKQVEIYLSTRPEMASEDVKSDPVLREISVQPIGRTGYTAIVDASHFVILTHKHPTSVGKVLTQSTTYPSFWAVIERSAGGKPSWGYYDWVEPDGSTRKKYAYITPIKFTTADGESGLTLWATTYIDEFSAPVAQARQKIAAETRKTNVYLKAGRARLLHQFLVITAVMLSFVIVCSIGFSRTITRPVIRLKRIAENLNQGNLDTPVDVKTSDEIGDLARSFDGMRLSLSSFYEDLERKVRDRTEQIRESERRLASIIDFLPDATLVVDAQGKVVAWNKAMEEMTGKKAAEMLGKGDYEYAVPFYAERRPALIDMVTVPNEVLEAKYRDIRRLGDVLAGETFAPVLRGGGRWVSARASALRDSKGQVVGAIESVRDITERKQMQEALQQAKEVAERAAHARSEFVANMSHEIRTPMNGIMGMLDLALATELGREQREYLQLARSAADSLLVIIDDILDFSKIEAKKLDLERIEFPLAELCDEILPLAGIEASRKGLELVCELDPKVPDVLVGDPVRLKQVLVNLIKNAVKFTEKGHVLLRTEKRGEPEPGVCELHFSVTDTGVGIPADKLSVIFDSFRQADSSMSRRYGGTGLGLTISKSLVEMMGGTIWVESTAGAGSTFHFTVPFRTGTKTGAARRCRLPELRGRRTLVIDDNDVNRRILRGYLESWELAVDEAADGGDGLRKIRAAQSPAPEYDVVLLDCLMPGMSGFDVAAELLGHEGFTKPIIVMLSSMEEKDSRERCRALGVARFLVKPVSPSTLYDAIISVVGLPTSEAGGRAAPEPAAITPAAIPVGARILVAEDNPMNVEVARQLLKRAGIECDVARNGAEALEAVARKRYDVVLMDIQMPGMDGMEATQRIREQEETTGEHVPIVALTAHSMKGDRARFLAGGMDDYLAKPLDAARLYQVIARCARDARARGDAPHAALGGGAAEGAAELFDAGDLLQRMGGDEALVVEVLRMFLDECGKALESLAAAVRSGSAQRVRSAAHYLKSMSANVSARALSRASHEVEQLGAAEDVAGAAGRLAAIGETSRHTITAIRNHLGKS